MRVRTTRKNVVCRFFIEDKHGSSRSLARTVESNALIVIGGVRAYLHGEWIDIKRNKREIERFFSGCCDGCENQIEAKKILRYLIQSIQSVCLSSVVDEHNTVTGPWKHSRRPPLNFRPVMRQQLLVSEHPYNVYPGLHKCIKMT
jgi:hypothetical protein